MKSHHYHVLQAMLFCTSLIAGCASSNTTPTNSAKMTTTQNNGSTQTSKLDKKKPASPGAEPDCD